MLSAPRTRKAGIPRLGFLLRQAAAVHRLKMERALADLHVTPPQFLALRLIAENPGISNADLSRMASLTTPTVSVIVSNLKRRGALMSRPHAVHGRIQQLDLSEEGRPLLAVCKERASEVEADLQAGMTAAEIRTICSWLKRSGPPFD